MSSRPVRLGLAFLLVAVLAAAAVPIGHSLWLATIDPRSAHCTDPAPTLGKLRIASTHRELDVVFTCEGALLAGTLYFPIGPGPYPGVVWVHGAGEAARLGWGGQVVPGLVGAGLAVLSYDKRGVGQSEGSCCPGDQGHFNLLTADVEGAVRVVRAQSGVNPDKVGLVGASQAGWIAPRAANEMHAAFVALASAPTVSERTANLYERLASGEKGSSLVRRSVVASVRPARPDTIRCQTCSA